MNKKLRNVIFSVGILSLVALSTIQTNKVFHLEKQISINEENLKVYQQRLGNTLKTLDIIEEYEYFPLDFENIDKELSKLILDAINDPYAQYINEENYTDPFGGLQQTYGCKLTKENGEYFIWSIDPHTNNEHKELHLGDKVTHINGIPTNKITPKLLRTLIKEIDLLQLTTISLKDEINQTITIEKENQVINTVTGELIDSNTAIIEISNFYSDTYTRVLRKLTEYRDAGIKNLVIDLRNNNGGSLDSAKFILDLFIDKADLFYMENNKDEVQVLTSKDKYPKFEFNLAILVDRRSASAAELFAASMRNNIQTPIIGETTYGKGVSQFYIDTYDDYILKLTANEIYANPAEKYHGYGIKPDVYVESKPWITPHTDEALEAALSTFGIDSNKR
ncbi:S41 family peptidase [Fusibacter sp. JL216-2]|uniref:S41 family peptidase n=1 Tax=Fusibacter sp. JL216-2 TaxID=3071453 RepID=UPI003D347FAA